MGKQMGYGICAESNFRDRSDTKRWESVSVVSAGDHAVLSDRSAVQKIRREESYGRDFDLGSPVAHYCAAVYIWCNIGSDRDLVEPSPYIFHGILLCRVSCKS